MENFSIFSGPDPQKAYEEYNTGGNRRWINGLLVATQEDKESELEIVVDGVVRAGSNNIKGSMCTVSTFQPLPPSRNYHMQFRETPKIIRNDTGNFFMVPSSMVNITFISNFEGEFTMPCVSKQIERKNLFFPDKNVFLCVSLYNGKGQGYHKVEVSTQNGEVIGGTTGSFYTDGISSMCIPLRKNTVYILSSTTGSKVPEKLPTVYHCSWIADIPDDYVKVPHNETMYAEQDGFLVARLVGETKSTSGTVSVYSSSKRDLVDASSKEAFWGSDFVMYNVAAAPVERLTRTITLPILQGNYYRANYEFVGDGSVELRMLHIKDLVK